MCSDLLIRKPAELIRLVVCERSNRYATLDEFVHSACRQPYGGLRLTVITT